MSTRAESSAESKQRDAPLAPVSRRTAKAARTDSLLNAASRLFADRGFHGVSIEQLAKAVGISGPALYRHFASKGALLAEVLRDISQRLLDGGMARVGDAGSPQEALHLLVDFHTDFSLTEPERIRVQDRDFANLSADAAHDVRHLQREYIELWVDVLQDCDPALDAPTARLKVQACFGLLNSTPHSARGGDRATTKAVLTEMALAALAAPPLTS
ncbi:TetR family transcriptional regulator [Antricoccus suffuscus]|uniref:TetR family transcriptional regulator n=1 Tax=Antricoccus suffuscus TaxID=1629062 RepID=A0A2T1A266_9ACTN|nr:TetR/AcrR family transcriptional regulator [Antricoccus suffuscus]PRZ42699.1 TetR family transcriptional regulator [Antricoccus suffuscus]